MTRANFNRITLVSVTGLQDATRAVPALELSRRQMPGARALLCSPNSPRGLPEGIAHRKIAPMNYHEYSWFVMFALWKLIDTDFALVLQDDGWVLDGNNWRDEFFDYDYIGAPVHQACVESAAGTEWISHFKWRDRIDRPGHVVRPVLNGGFSLRSRRMLRALMDHPEIKVEIPRPELLDNSEFRMRWSNRAPNEDVQLTATLRPQLEAVGIKYAPLDLCKLFAVEDSGPIYGDADFMDLFGHHAFWRRLVSIDPPSVEYKVKRSLAQRAFREMDVVRMLEARGYRVTFAAE
ncbi:MULTISPECIES: DUF5672 family protein [Caballeronia]|uniref:DUF5672 family protein n=1 Tax=Caballeronia TaxID=1827195 RepID=UPI001EF44180|nr:MULTISPECIES: DUF5672 family protein [Caballeronia]MCG7404449.1 glycosyl transferase family 17 [Caballeronia zhejiangensis]